MDCGIESEGWQCAQVHERLGVAVWEAELELAIVGGANAVVIGYGSLAVGANRCPDFGRNIFI